MITTLTGDNNYLISEEVKRLSKGFSSEHGAINIEKIDCEETDFEHIFDSISNTSLFSTDKLLILRNIDKNKELIEKLDTLLNARDTANILIILPKVDKRSALFKQLKKQTDFHDFASNTSLDLGSWAASEVQARGGHIARQDATFLVDRLGTNQLLLDSEINKLLSYDSNITKQSIELLTEPLPQSKVFNLLDAVFSGDAKRALNIYDDQRQQRAEPLYIISMVTWQLHIFAIIKTAKNRTLDQIAKDAKLNPYVVKKSATAVSSVSLTRLKQMIKSTLQLDIELKSEPINPDDGMKNLLIQMSEAY